MQGPLIGWRLWNWRDGVLGSVASRAAWNVDIATIARCYHGSYHAVCDVPLLDCACGLYAYTIPTAELVHTAGSMWVGGGRPVLGRVALWGKVIEHRYGYRAEYGRPLELLFVDRVEFVSHHVPLAGVSAAVIDAISQNRDVDISDAFQSVYHRAFEKSR